MSRRARILRNIAIGLAALMIVVVVAAVVVVRTAWFHDYVKQKIITAAEEGAGGKVEIGSFLFEWSHLRATVTDFVIHGDEPAGSVPYLRVRRTEVDIRLFTSLKHILDLTYLGLDGPEANIMVFPDGRTNVPSPKQKSNSNTTGLQTVVDLAVGHFELTNGLLMFNSQKQALDLRGNNLRVQLRYDQLKQGYKGEVSLEPLYVASGRNPPVHFTITLPVAFERDRIEFQNARISTAASEILISGSVENLRNPKTSAHINGHVALADLKNAASLPVGLDAAHTPSMVNLDANATLADDVVQVTGLRLSIGHSDIEASGRLKDPAGSSSVQFKIQLALDEIGRLARVAARPLGTVTLNGTAKLDSKNNYEAVGNLQAKDVSFQQGAGRIGNVNVFSAVHLNTHRLDLEGLRLAAFGAEIVANVSLEDFAHYKLNGNLRHLDLRTVARAVGQKDLAYDGTVSGSVAAEGDLKTPGTKGIVAHARLSIAPGRRGIPVSGRLYPEYNGEAENIGVGDSFIVLPHTRINLSGSLGNRLNIALATHDLNDLLATASPSDPPPVTLNGGRATLTAVVLGRLTSPNITGHLAVNRFMVEGRQFDALALDIAGSSSRAAITSASLSRGPMQAQFAAAVGLKNWKTTPNQPVSAEASVRNGDLADVMAMAGQATTGYSGALGADANVTGTIANPRGTANLRIADGTIQDESFDNIQIQVNMADQLVTLPTAYISAGAARLSLTAEFRHPRDSFTTGQLHAHVQSNQVDLARLRAAQKEQPNRAGLVQIDADVTGNLSETHSSGNGQNEFLPTSVNLDASARGLRFEGQNYGNLNATARTKGQTVNYNASSDFAGSNIRVNGNTQLARGYPTNADVNIRHLPIERMLVLAKRQDIPAKGTVSGTAHFGGSMENPEGNVDLDLENAAVHDEPIDHVRARVTYLTKTIDVPQFEIVSGPSRLELTARYDHPLGNLQAGNIQFRVTSSRLDLTRIRNLQKMRAGMGGTLQLTANGAATVRAAEPHLVFHDLNAHVAATGIAAQGKNLGDLTLTADTTGGRLNFALDSNLASSSIHGRGNAQLSGDYPVTAQLTFDNVSWTQIQALLGRGGSEPPNFEALAGGQITMSGPAMRTGDMRGSLQLTRVQLNTTPQPGSAAKPVVIQNQGPITATLDHGIARLENFHLTGPQTDLQAVGKVSLQAQTVDATVNANTNLGVLQQFNRDVVSSGEIVLATAVRGTLAKPVVNGRLELHNASLNYTEIPNGITNANGFVLFNGNNASVRSLTAELGGGKVTVSGFVAYNELMRFGLRARAANVRIRLQQGVSVVADANVQLTGGTKASAVSGTVTIDQVTYTPASDFGSILSRAAPPVQSPIAP